MSQVKYRKCPACSGKMTLKKTSKGKFWGCTEWRNTGCQGSAPYHGEGARSGMEVDIREIENGYIISAGNRYVDSVEDEAQSEVYCADHDTLRAKLTTIFNEKVDYLVNRIKETTDFVDEIDESKHEVRVKAAKGTKNVDELLKSISKSRKKAEEGHTLED